MPRYTFKDAAEFLAIFAIGLWLSFLMFESRPDWLVYVLFVLQAINAVWLVIIYRRKSCEKTMV